MKTRLYYLLTIAVMIFALTACGDDGPKAPENSRRTVLVYMVAANSLNSAAYYDMLEMQRAVEAGALGGNGRLLVMRADYNSTPALLEITEQGTVTLESYGNDFEALDPESMSAVVADARRLAPSDEFGVILWSHGTGWTAHNNRPRQGARSWGDDRGKTMTIPELAEGLRGNPIDFIYFDCCFMGNVETIYELRDCAPLIAATPTETPYDGMPYEQTLPVFFARNFRLEDAAQATFDYYDAQHGSSRSLAIAVYSTDAVADVARAMADLLRQTGVTPAGDTDLSAIQQYGFKYDPRAPFDGYYYDLADYAAKIGTDKQLDALNNAMARFVKFERHTPYMWGEFPLERVSGVSTYIYGADPEKARWYGYEDLRWYADVVAPAL